MRRYGIARFLTPEQRERAAAARYEMVEIGRTCVRGDCDDRPAFVPAARTPDGNCPLGEALGSYATPTAWYVEFELSKTGENKAIRAAARRFIHDVDSGRIGPDDVAASLGVKP